MPNPLVHRSMSRGHDGRLTGDQPNQIGNEWDSPSEDPDVPISDAQAAQGRGAGSRLGDGAQKSA